MSAQGIIHLSIVPQRKEPSDRSEMVNQLLFGDEFEILEKEKSWVKIKLLHDDYEGWIDEKQFIPLSHRTNDHKDSTVYCSSVHATVTSEFGPVNLVMGSRLHEFYNGVFKLGNLAFHSYCDTVDGIFTGSTETLLETAKQYLNTPYLWGGRSPFGIDCSGLVQMTFAMNGVRLPRDAWQQGLKGQSVTLDESRPGDLAFFQNTDGKIIHVGIILETGNNKKIIHASGKVRIDKLDEKGIFNLEKKEYSHNLHSLKRVFTNEDS